MPAGLHPWPSQSTATKLYLTQPGGITEHLMQELTQHSHTGSSQRLILSMLISQTVFLCLWKMKKDNKKMHEFKNCLPLKLSQMISTTNMIKEAGAWLCTYYWCWANKASCDHPWDGFGDPKKHSQKPASHLLASPWFLPLPFSPPHSIPLSLLLNLSSAELCSHSPPLLSLCLSASLFLFTPVPLGLFWTPGEHVLHLHANTIKVTPGMKTHWKQ